MLHQPTPVLRDNQAKPIHVEQQTKWNWNNNGELKFLLIASGIFMSFILVGMLKVQIMRGCYSDDRLFVVDYNCPEEGRFSFAVTIVGMQMLCAFLFIKGILQT